MGKIGLLSLALAATLAFVGCESDSSPSTDTSSTELVNSSYYTPEGVSTTKLNASTVALNAQEGEVVGLIYEDSQYIRTAPLERTFRVTQSASLNKLRNLESQLSSIASISSSSRLTEQSFTQPFEYITGDYAITANELITPSELMNDIATGLTQTNNYPASHATASTHFRLSMAVAVVDNHYYVLFSLVSEENYAQMSEVASSMTRATNLTALGVEVTEFTDRFIGESGAQNADFLFVVDNSGSMSAEQNAIAQAANDFETAVHDANLQDYSIGIISTGQNINSTTCTSISSCASALVNSDGLYTSIEAFKNHVVLGTNGSGTETGIYNAEQSLLSEGVLSKIGFPTTGNLSIIIISDEPSQYERRSDTSFNVNDNVFTQNGYQVYSIIDSEDSGDYENLAAATGGFSASILNTNSTTNTLDYSEIMRKVAQGASGAASQFVLTKAAGSDYIVAVTSVKVNGVEVTQSTNNGWGYNAANNSIVFYGTSLPKSGDSIEVSYTHTNIVDVSDNTPTNPIEPVNPTNPSTVGNSSFIGAVFDPTTHQPVVGASVTADGSGVTYSQTTDALGNYIFTNILQGTYDVSVNNNGYTSALGEVSVSPQEVVNYGQLQLLPTSESGNYQFGGTLINAVTSDALSNATINIHEGYENPTGPLVRSISTNSSGDYSTSLASGYYTLVVSKSGYITREITVLVWSENLEQGITLTPNLINGEVRITLTWGTTPFDLDSHLALMNGTTRTEHVFYYNAVSTDGKINLDRDDIDSFGPETITINSLDTSKVYKYYVHDYTNYFGSHPDLSQSAAVVTVDTASQTYTFNVPNAQGTAWKVFEIQNGKIVPCSGASCIFDANGDTDANFGIRSKTDTLFSYKK